MDSDHSNSSNASTLLLEDYCLNNNLPLFLVMDRREENFPVPRRRLPLSALMTKVYIFLTNLILWARVAEDLQRKLDHLKASSVKTEARRGLKRSPGRGRPPLKRLVVPAQFSSVVEPRPGCFHWECGDLEAPDRLTLKSELYNARREVFQLTQELHGLVFANFSPPASPSVSPPVQRPVTPGVPPVPPAGVPRAEILGSPSTCRGQMFCGHEGASTVCLGDLSSEDRFCPCGRFARMTTAAQRCPCGYVLRNYQVPAPTLACESPRDLVPGPGIVLEEGPILDPIPEPLPLPLIRSILDPVLEPNHEILWIEEEWEDDV